MLLFSGISGSNGQISFNVSFCPQNIIVYVEGTPTVPDTLTINVLGLATVFDCSDINLILGLSSIGVLTNNIYPVIPVAPGLIKGKNTEFRLTTAPNANVQVYGVSFIESNQVYLTQQQTINANSSAIIENATDILFTNTPINNINAINEQSVFTFDNNELQLISFRYLNTSSARYFPISPMFQKLQVFSSSQSLTFITRIIV